jgi:hypothetical protein
MIKADFSFHKEQKQLTSLNKRPSLNKLRVMYTSVTKGQNNGIKMSEHKRQEFPTFEFTNS